MPEGQGFGTSTGRTLIEARPLESPCSGRKAGFTSPETSSSCIRRKCQHRPRPPIVGPKAPLLPVCTAFPKRHCSSSFQQNQNPRPLDLGLAHLPCIDCRSPGFKKSFRFFLLPSSSGTALLKLPLDGCYPQAGPHMEQM